MRSTLPNPREPDSKDEWDLEQAAFAAANDPVVPTYAQSVIAQLWAEVCAREAWRGLATMQKPLPADFAKVLYDGIADGSLYVKS